MTLLQQRDSARRQRRLDLHTQTRRQLQAALAEFIPGRKILVFGSLAKPGVFNDRSDIDIGLFESPETVDACSLAGKLSERLHRPVDVIWIDRCRFRKKLLLEGERWTT